MIVKKMSDDGVVKNRNGWCRMEKFDIIGDPFVRSFIVIGMKFGISWRIYSGAVGIHFAGIQQHRCAIGENVKCGISMTSIDMVNIQVTRFPRRKDLAHLLRHYGRTAYEASKNKTYGAANVRVRKCHCQRDSKQNHIVYPCCLKLLVANMAHVVRIVVNTLKHQEGKRYSNHWLRKCY